MTEQNKQLLLKDLCARLPYGVIIYSLGIPHEQELIGYIPDIENYNIKPYLRPMFSMTEEEKEEYRNECNKVLSMPFKINGPYPITDWLNAHHFDYRGLIPMGLALEAPKGMYKTE